MNRNYHIDRSKMLGSPATAVVYCSKCGAPVIVKPGAMDEHEKRIHAQADFRPISDRP